MCGQEYLHLYLKTRRKYMSLSRRQYLQLASLPALGSSAGCSLFPKPSTETKLGHKVSTGLCSMKLSSTRVDQQRWFSEKITTVTGLGSLTTIFSYLMMPTRPGQLLCSLAPSSSILNRFLQTTVRSPIESLYLISFLNRDS